MIDGLTLLIGILFVVFVGGSGVRFIQQTDRGLVERFGRFARFATPGITWIIPLIERIRYVDITEQIRNCEQQEIITGDNLNALVDLQVYYRVGSDEDSVKNSEYNISDYDLLITNLARTTARNIIGEMEFKKVNSERNVINLSMKKHLVDETKHWGIQITRVELKDIQPPKDVQNAMNQVIVSTQKKTAAIDFASAVETEADGKKRAIIKEAQGSAEAITLNAEAQARAIEVIQKQLSKNEVYVEYLKAKQWDGKLPNVTGGAIPFLNVGGDKK